ncbi:HNH endonuclease [Paenibacillus sp. ATY16]|nr:HNH endonuclease [Paenibacillus sp. ATY16]MCK9862457.1 HNH endonuclease [Paenibacillus sp. ATY16]
MTDNLQTTQYKQCVHCLEQKPVTDFLRRTGRRSGPASRRGSCRSCRKTRSRITAPVTVSAANQEAAVQPAAPLAAMPEAVAATAVPVSPAEHAVGQAVASKPAAAAAPAVAPKRPRPSKAPARTAGAGGKYRPRPLPANYLPTDASLLRTTRKGTVWMRGKTDKGRRWHQEIELELAVTLVKERAAVIVNRTTIRRLFSNKDFRSYILTRDNYTCHFCGQYGDTIDHMLPRAKGGHTTPDNCVCACNECNQSKADKDIDEFMREL